MVASAAITIEQLTEWLRRFHELVIKNQTELTDLDSAIGDADHGINMARGMTAVIDKLDGFQTGHVNELFKTVAMTLVMSVGGASGPLYGTFFLRFAGAAGPAIELDTAILQRVSGAIHERLQDAHEYVACRMRRGSSTTLK